MVMLEQQCSICDRTRALKSTIIDFSSLVLKVCRFHPNILLEEATIVLLRLLKVRFIGHYYSKVSHIIYLVYDIVCVYPVFCIDSYFLFSPIPKELN